VDPATGLIDYDGLEKSASLFKPKLIIAGVSCYARNLDYARFRQIADQNGALLMADMAHVRHVWMLFCCNFSSFPFELSHCRPTNMSNFQACVKPVHLPYFLGIRVIIASTSSEELRIA
jgi:hypothetical protein